MACATNPNKAREEKTALEHGEDVGGGVQVGQNSKGEVMTSQKQKLADQLRDLQKGVYELEAEIYGYEDYGRKGLYGVLQECMDQKGELKRLPTKAVLTKNEDRFNGKMVIDEQKNLVNVSEEYFLDRIRRFENYRDSYEKQKEDYEERLRICQARQNQNGKEAVE
ncbi:MAG: hypothetical protein C5B49_10860 [Bdellovibrio sp.]|nr:MAG: hypothetical protein C5B49_10860 [Bdellovibrio sp.]